MKKTSKALLIAAIVLIVLGLVVLGMEQIQGNGSLFSAIGNGELHFNLGGIIAGKNQAGYTVCTAGEESFSSSEVSSLTLNWISGSVIVEPYDGDRLLLRETSKKALSEGQCMRWKLNGGRLTVLFCANNLNNVPDKELTVLVPRSWTGKECTVDTVSASVTLRELQVTGVLELDTVSGDILATDCHCADLDVDTVSGSVKLVQTALRGTLEVDTVSGTVRTEGCVFDKADVDTTSGAVTLTDLCAGCQITVDTASGTVALDYAGRPGRIHVDTISGDVALRIPRGTTLDLDFDSGSGKLSGSYRSADDGVSVEVDTASGNLTIEEG